MMLLFLRSHYLFPLTDGFVIADSKDIVCLTRILQYTKELQYSIL